MIASFIVTLAVGIICIVLGISNARGNISSLHSYHRSRVAQEDVPAFGKLVGIGTLIVGASIIVLGIFMLLAELLTSPVMSLIGSALLIIGLAIGLGLSFYAMKKYNKGIF